MMLLSQNLKAFMLVCETGTIVAAAKKLRIGQTAVTQRIKNLESEMNVSLFLRRPDGMTPTDEGFSLLQYCRESIETEKRVLSEMSKSGIDRDINATIVGPTSYISSRAVGACAELMLRWPRLNLRFVIDDSEDRSNWLKSGTSDFVVLYPNQVIPQFDSRALKPDEYILLCSKKWEGRPLKEILSKERIFAFHPGDETSLNYLRAHNLLDFLQRPRLYANENRTLSELLIRGVGFGLLEKTIAEPLLKEKKLIQLNEGKSLKDKIAICWYSRPNMPKYFEDILNALVDA